MKPHKKPTILDFFSAIPRRPQPSPHDARPLPGTSPRALSTTQATETPALQASPSVAAVPPVPTTTHASSPDPQLPTASQTSVNSGGSKRIVSNGEQVVLNSDSDQDSLLDFELNFGASTASFKIVAPASRPKRTPQHDQDGLRKPGKKVKSTKDRFDRLLQTAQKTSELERIIMERKADLDKTADESAVSAFVLDKDALEHAVQDDDDPEKADRLYLAMQRTNATHVEHAFHFFGDAAASLETKTLFPASCLPAHRWTASFRDASTRDQAFLTGFAHQIFRLQELPVELASWMVDQVCLNPSDALDLKYLEILEAHNQHLRTVLDRNRLQSIFNDIGADVASLRSEAQLLPTPSTHTAGVQALPTSLKSIAKLLQHAAPHLRTDSRSYSLSLLCYTSLDDRVLADPDLVSAIQDAIEAIMCHFVDNRQLARGLSDLLPRLLARISQPVMQQKLVCALPAKSPSCAYFQRHLALSFLFYPDVVDVPLTDARIVPLVHKRLNMASVFRIDKDTNYHFLTARMTLLDIAIGPGLSSVPYPPLVSRTESWPDSSPMMPPVPELDEVKEFNRDVDALAQHIKVLGNSIVEAGAVADISILSAKDAVERLCSRLEHAVRIGGRKTHDVFGSDDEGIQVKVTDIFRKVAKAKARKSAAATAGIFDQDEDTDDAVAAQIKAETAA
ncbi:hypothetical protein ACEQ8H_003106 [Pleosporales sp. CAS-2024a]